MENNGSTDMKWLLILYSLYCIVLSSGGEEERRGEERDCTQMVYFMWSL